MRELLEKLRQYNSFTVFSHVSPDGDALGSAAALCLLLEALHKTAYWRGDANIPENLRQFPLLAALPGRVGRGECAVAVDCADLTRLGDFAGEFKQHACTLVIDHHATNPGFGQVNWLSSQPATGLMILSLADALSLPLTKPLAELLYIAVLMDTGGFVHAGTDQAAMEQVARLYGADIDPSYITQTLFSRSLPRTRLLGAALSHILQFHNGKMAFLLLEKEDFTASQANESDTDGIVDYALGIRGTIAGALIKHSPDGYRVSMRSKSALCNVAGVAQKYGGGGHKMAAGCTVAAASAKEAAEIIAQNFAFLERL